MLNTTIEIQTRTPQKHAKAKPIKDNWLDMPLQPLLLLGNRRPVPKGFLSQLISNVTRVFTYLQAKWVHYTNSHTRQHPNNSGSAFDICALKANWTVVSFELLPNQLHFGVILKGQTPREGTASSQLIASIYIEL